MPCEATTDVIRAPLCRHSPITKVKKTRALRQPREKFLLKFHQVQSNSFCATLFYIRTTASDHIFYQNISLDIADCT